MILSDQIQNKEVAMTDQEMREAAKNVQLFKMNYKAGIRLPNLEAFLAGDDSALDYDPKARGRLEKMLEKEAGSKK